MISLRNLKVQNYLSLRDIDVELESLNVLVGPNGAGKSNFLDAIRFLGDFARGSFESALGDEGEGRGGFDAVYYHGKGKTPPSIRFEVEAAVTKHASAAAPDEYTLYFSKTKRGSIRRVEEFKFKRYRGPGRRITIRGGRLTVKDNRGETQRRVDQEAAALAILPQLGEQGGEQVEQVAELFTTFRVFDVNVRRAREPSPIERAPVLADDASNLAAYLRWLREERSPVFARVIRDVQYVLPGLRGIEFRPIGGATEAVALELVEDHMSEPTPLAKASFGTIRALALFAMLHDPDPPKLTCVEEVDHGLHPYALDRIVQGLRAASKQTQLIVATHSPALVNRLRPDELVICERDPETGASEIPAIDAEEIAAMETKSNLRLGELWFSGVLGGVPE